MGQPIDDVGEKKKTLRLGPSSSRGDLSRELERGIEGEEEEDAVHGACP